MRLLMITGLGSARDLASGKKGAFYNTLEEFHKYWSRIDIIAPKISRSSTSGRFEVELLFGNVYLHISPWPIIFHPFWFIKKALALHKEVRFDLMTVHEFPPFYNGIAARLLWNLRKISYVLEVFHIVGYPKAASVKELIYRMSYKLFLKFDASKARAVRVMNRNQAPSFIKQCGVPESKIKFIPAIYIDLDIFKPMSLAKEYDLIFLGRLEKNKGIDLLLESTRKLKNQIPNFKMLIVGDGPIRDWIQAQTTNYQLPITNYGWAKDQKEISELINKSKLLIVTSYNEGGPRVVFEAMACGVPALATLVGIVPDFRSSITVIDWDADDIVSKVKKLLLDKQVYEGMKLQGLSAVRQLDKKTAIRNYAEKLKALSDENGHNA